MSLKNLISSKSNLNQTQNIFVCRLGRAWFGELHILHSLVYIKNFSCYKIKKHKVIGIKIYYCMYHKTLN